MNEVRKSSLQQARDWLSGEVEIRVGKAGLVLGAVALVVLLLVALD